jgi:hypothetical protein
LWFWKFCGLSLHTHTHTHTKIYIFILLGWIYRKKNVNFQFYLPKFSVSVLQKKNQNQRIVDPGYFKNLQELLFSMKKLVKSQSFCSWLIILFFSKFWELWCMHLKKLQIPNSGIWDSSIWSFWEPSHMHLKNHLDNHEGLS